MHVFKPNATPTGRPYVIVDWNQVLVAGSENKNGRTSMKKLILAATAVFAMAGAAAADPILGTWRTIADDNGNSGLIEVVQCGDAYCGTLIAAFDASGAEMASENVGRQLIWDTRPAGGNEYRGKVYSPDRDREYNSRLTLTGDSLSVSGCVLGICREGGVWTRQ
jgi:uncharacterized protein (DUF2147 family)